MSGVLRYKQRFANFPTICLLLGIMLSSCSFPGVISTSQQLPPVSEKQVAQQLPPIRLPEDEGAHNNLTEWWYYTGHFVATQADGQQHSYGFELVVFQVARGNFLPIYLAHFAISDITRGEFHYDQRRITSSTPVLSGARGIDVHVGDWSVQGLNGQDQLVAAMKDYAINLQLVGRKPPTLHNGNGLITYGLAGYSYYYSRTRMAVTGTIVDHGQQLSIEGQAWMDHQWGNFLTLGDSGWDWYSIQLNDNTEMMVYLIRDATGRTLSTYVGYIDADGLDHLLSGNALHVTVLDKWASPITGITYPSGWRLTIDDPHLPMSLTIVPQLKDQELVTLNSTGNTYWEGAVTLEGQYAGKPVDGLGYVELTGYAKRGS